MSEKITYITQKGLNRLESELDHLRTVRRREVAEYLKETIVNIEDPEFLYAQEEQAFVEGRIQALEGMLANFQIIEPGNRGGLVDIGTIVVIKGDDSDSETYTIVGSAEANPSGGFISDESPIGKALMGSIAGDEREVKTPSGLLRYRVLAVN
jgi:transcription elongation factor GreA